MAFSGDKKKYMTRLSDKNNVISAVAIDQRGSLKKMIASFQDGPASDQQVEDFKRIVSEELTPYASAILLDPMYGIPAAKARDKDAGWLISYEKTGYDITRDDRLPDILDDWSVERQKEAGADATKFLLYYDPDEDDETNDKKKAMIERVGAECLAEGLPLFVELITYDRMNPTNDLAFAKKKPAKVLAAMEEFAKDRYHIDVLKMEVPVIMKFVEGYNDGGEVAYTREEALKYFKAQSDVTDKPYIFLSGGVSAEMFQEELKFAKEAGAKYNGVLCGRATWSEGVEPFVTKGEDACREWMRTQGRKNIEELDAILQATATPIDI